MELVRLKQKRVNPLLQGKAAPPRSLFTAPNKEKTDIRAGSDTLRTGPGVGKTEHALLSRQPPTQPARALACPSGV